MAIAEVPISVALTTATDRRRVFVLAGLVLLGVVVGGCGGEMALARCLDEKGDLAGAVGVYSAIVEKDSDDLSALGALAVDLLILQRYDEALPVQERIVFLDEKDVQTRVELGFNYLNHQDRASDAARVLTEAAALEPSGQHFLFVAQAQIRSNDREGAEASLRRSIDADPAYGYAYTVLRDLLISLGRRVEADELGDSAQLNGIALSDEGEEP